MEITLIIVGGILIGCIIGLSWFAGTDAPYVPTKNIRIRKMLRWAGLKKGEVFYELGSGDGRVVIEAAKMGAVAYGVEQSWIRVLLSRWKTRDLPNTHFIHGDIFKLFQTSDVIARSDEIGPWQSILKRFLRHFVPLNDIINADLVFIFLLPKGVEKLEPILKQNLKKGSKVITQTFHFKSWKPYKKILIKDKNTPNTPLGKNVLEGDFWIYKV